VNTARSISVGDELTPVTAESNLTTSVMYAGASGDMNPLHYDPSFAAQVSPTGGIIAHGMYSMGLTSRMLTAFAGGAERVVDRHRRRGRQGRLGGRQRLRGADPQGDGAHPGLRPLAPWPAHRLSSGSAAG